jgi:hypothetical protein
LAGLNVSYFESHRKFIANCFFFIIPRLPSHLMHLLNCFIRLPVWNPIIAASGRTNADHV